MRLTSNCTAKFKESLGRQHRLVCHRRGQLRFFRSASEIALVLCLMLTAGIDAVAQSQNGPQRMRVPSGEYTFSSGGRSLGVGPGAGGSGGSGHRLPAYCLDADKRYPRSGEKFIPASSSRMFISRRKPGGSGTWSSPAPLADKNEWLTVSGAGSGTELTVNIHQSEYDYKLTVEGDTPGVMGIADQRFGTSADTETVSKIIAKHPGFPAIRELDEFESQLRALFGTESQEAQRFSEAKLNVSQLASFKGSGVTWLEHAWLAKTPIDVRSAMTEFLAQYRTQLKARFGGTNGISSLPAEIFAIRTGRIPTVEEISLLGKVLNANVQSVRTKFKLELAEFQKTSTQVQALKMLGGMKARMGGRLFPEWAIASWEREESLAGARELLLKLWLGRRLSTRDPIRTAAILGELSKDEGKLIAEVMTEPAQPSPDYLMKTVNIEAIGSNVAWTVRTATNSQIVWPNQLEDVLKSFKGWEIVTDQREALATSLTNAKVALAALLRSDEFLKREKLAAFVEDSKPKRKGVQASRHIRAPQGRELAIEIVGLKEAADHSGLGDSIIVRFPNNRIFVIDTCNDATGMKRVVDRIREMNKGDGPVEIDVLLTHAHRDHLGGFDFLLAGVRSEGWKLNSVVFGKYPNLSTTALNLIDQLGKLLVETKVGAGISIFSSGLENTQGKSGLTVRGHNFNSRLYLTVENTAGVNVELFQVNDPKSANESSIIVRMAVRGVSYLLTGDIDLAAMRKLLQMQKDGTITLAADVMKWPHHVSFPQNWSDSDPKELVEFLKAVNPHTVRFSNLGSKQTKEMEERATAFIRKTLDSENFKTRIESTNDWESKSGRHLHEEVMHKRNIDGSLVVTTTYAFNFGEED